MAVLGKLTSVNYTCYELGHTWTPSCTRATTGVGSDVLKAALKIYSSLYLVAGVARRKGKDYFKKKFWQETLRSTTFLTTNGTLFITFFCVWRKMFSSYYYLNTFLCGIPACALSVSIERKDRKLIGHFKILPFFTPAFWASFLAIQIERKSRRGLLAIYMANVATETMYRMFKARGLGIPIPHGEVLLFSIAMAVYFYLYKRNSLPDSMSSIFKFLVGKDEIMKKEPSLGRSSHAQTLGPPANQMSFVREGLKPIHVFIQWLESQARHPSCLHQHSCIHYVLKGFSKLFCVGYLVQAGMRFVSHPRAIKHSFLHTDNLKLAAFLGGFSGIFRAVSCLLRHVNNKDEEVHGLLAGFLAGFSMLCYKSVTIALYSAFKLAEVLYFKGIEKNIVPYIKCADVIIYSISTAFVFHAAVVEPTSLRPAYWKFLLKVTDGKFGMMNRKLLEPHLPRAAEIAPDFWPNYDPRYTSLYRPSN